MDALFALTQRAAYPLLRFSLGVVLVWIGALKFVDPSPVVGLIGASPLALLASPACVYFLGVVEVALGAALFLNLGTKYVGLALIGLFAGTLFILVTTPKVAYGEAGFPLLSLPGEFLLKDLVLLASAITLASLASAHEGAYAAALRLRAELP